MLGQTRFDDILERLASDAPSPGSGAAAAAALGLGIACLRKAVSISVKRPNEGSGRLHEAEQRLCALTNQALMAADADMRGFPRLLAIRSEGTSGDVQTVADDLAALSARIAALCEQVFEEADQLMPKTKPNMANDILAARLLSKAALEIAQANAKENCGVAS